MSLGRSAISLPVLRYSSAGAGPPSGAALYFTPGYDKTRLMAGTQPNRLDAQPSDPFLAPSYADDTLLAGRQPTHYLEPE